MARLAYGQLLLGLVAWCCFTFITPVAGQAELGRSKALNGSSSMDLRDFTEPNGAGRSLKQTGV
jgi:hypothetical protein